MLFHPIDVPSCQVIPVLTAVVAALRFRRQRAADEVEVIVGELPTVA
jgi:hypothetical protein